MKMIIHNSKQRHKKINTELFLLRSIFFFHKGLLFRLFFHCIFPQCSFFQFELKMGCWIKHKQSSVSYKCGFAVAVAIYSLIVFTFDFLESISMINGKQWKTAFASNIKKNANFILTKPKTITWEIAYAHVIYCIVLCVPIVTELWLIQRKPRNWTFNLSTDNQDIYFISCGGCDRNWRACCVVQHKTALFSFNFLKLHRSMYLLNSE